MVSTWFGPPKPKHSYDQSPSNSPCRPQWVASRVCPCVCRNPERPPPPRNHWSGWGSWLAVTPPPWASDSAETHSHTFRHWARETHTHTHAWHHAPIIPCVRVGVWSLSSPPSAPAHYELRDRKKKKLHEQQTGTPCPNQTRHRIKAVFPLLIILFVLTRRDGNTQRFYFRNGFDF